MKHCAKVLACAALALAPLARSGGSQSPAQPYESKILQMRQDEAESLAAPDGWLSLVALQPLTTGVITVGSAEGCSLRLEHGIAHAFSLRVKGQIVAIGDADTNVTVAGKQPVPDAAISEDAPIRWSGLTATVIRRTGHRLFLRVSDPRSPNRKAFHNLQFYPIDKRYRLVADWVPYLPAHQLHMATVTGDILTLPSPGYAQFKLHGRLVRLDPYVSESETLGFLFRDGTSSTTTYRAGRELHAGRPSNGLRARGTVVLDFNTAFNPPCAYTPYGTCPLAPRQNRLSAAIPAGEKRYHD